MITQEKNSEMNADIFRLFFQQVNEMCNGLDLFLKKGNRIEESDLYEVYRLVHRCNGDAGQLALKEIARIAEGMVYPLRSAHQQRRYLTQPERSSVIEGVASLRCHCF
jgi:chemotaxis protein histidine kinase CheA